MTPNGVQLGTIEHKYLIRFNDADGMVLGVEFVDIGAETRLVLRLRDGSSDEEIADLMHTLLENPDVTITDPD